MPKLFAGLMISVAAAAATLPAWGLCAVCTAEIRLDTSLADCLLKRSSDALTQLATGTKGFVIIDLRDCRSRGSLPTAAPADGPAPLLDDRFVIDEPGLKCLSSQIAALDDNAMTPSRVFDLAKECPAQ